MTDTNHPVPIDPLSVLHKKELSDRDPEGNYLAVGLGIYDKEEEYVNALAGYFNMRGRVVQQEMKTGAVRPWEQLSNGEIEGFKPDDSKG